MDAVIDYLPSPLDIPPVEGSDPNTNEILTRKPADDEPLSALVFKIVTDPYVGRLAYIRIYSGSIEQGTTVFNPGKRILPALILGPGAMISESMPLCVAGNQMVKLVVR